MSRILKLYERSIEQKGQSDEEFELSKAIFKREQERLNVHFTRFIAYLCEQFNDLK